MTKKKRSNLARGKLKSTPFAIKTKAVDATGGVVIEGWANKAVVDRGLDYIAQNAWDLTNYQKNPIILFNHDKDKPIGRALEIKPTDDGLYIKAQISNSKDPFVSYIRDLISEGILNAFSVGFDSKDEGKDASGVNQITAAELYETSVVSLPMNQDSLFSLTSKELKCMKTYHEAKMAILKEKGAALASTLQDRIFDMENGTEGFNRDEALQKIADLAGVKVDDVKLVLVGDATGVDEKLLAAFAGYLGVPLADLQTLDGVDKDPTADGADEAEDEVVDQEEAAEESGEEEDKKPEAVMALPPKPPIAPLKPKKPGAAKPDVTKPNVAPADGKIPGEVPPPPAAAPAKEEAAPAAKKEGVPEIQAVKVPKSDNMTPEAAKESVEKAGYKADNMEDDEAFYVFHQEPKDAYKNTVDMDMDGMTVSVGLGKKVAPEADAPEEDKPQPIEKTVDASTVQPEVGDGNPAIDQAKQTNVLLGSLIDAQANTNDLLSALVQELQKTVMMSMGDKQPQVVADETEQKLLKVAETQLIELNNRIKNL